MIIEDAVYMTAEGLEQLKSELDHLRTTRREELSQKLQVAIAQGDLKENADYHAAKEEQGFVEGRIRTLEDSLRRAKLIEHNGPSDVVRVGSKVTVTEEGSDEPETYSIVGPHEASPANGLISNESPIGSALLGAKRGQTVSIQIPAGEIRFCISEIA